MATTKFKHIGWLCLSLLLGLSLTACDKSQAKPDDDILIIDYYPIHLYIEVQNAAGEDLVNPKHPESIVGEGQVAYAEIEGKRFELVKEKGRYPRNGKDVRSSWEVFRAYLPLWWGFTYNEPHKENTPWYLYIGEFDGGEDKVREIKLHWADGKTNTIKYSNKKHFKGSGKMPDIERHFYVDGKEQNRDGKLRITR